MTSEVEPTPKQLPLPLPKADTRPPSVYEVVGIPHPTLHGLDDEETQEVKAVSLEKPEKPGTRVGTFASHSANKYD